MDPGCGCGQGRSLESLRVPLTCVATSTHFLSLLHTIPDLFKLACWGSCRSLDSGRHTPNQHHSQPYWRVGREVSRKWGLKCQMAEFFTNVVRRFLKNRKEFSPLWRQKLAFCSGPICSLKSLWGNTDGSSAENCGLGPFSSHEKEMIQAHHNCMRKITAFPVHRKLPGASTGTNETPVFRLRRRRVVLSFGFSWLYSYHN